MCFVLVEMRKGASAALQQLENKNPTLRWWLETFYSRIVTIFIQKNKAKSTGRARYEMSKVDVLNPTVWQRQLASN